MTYQKWPVLLMCRDSISQRFFHTPVRQAPPTRAPRVMAGEIARGYHRRGRPTLVFARGVGRHLKVPGGAPSCGSNVLRLFSLCALATMDALISVHPNVQAILSVARKLTCQCPAKALECLVRPPGRRPGPGGTPANRAPIEMGPLPQRDFLGNFLES